MVIIDNHVHCPEKWADTVIANKRELQTFSGVSKLNPVKTVEDLLLVMDDVGVDKMCLFAPYVEWIWGNQHLRKVVERYPDRVIPIGVVNPRWGKIAIEEIRRFGEWGFRGLKLIPYSHSYPADCYSVQKVIVEAIKLDIPVHFHTSDHLVDKLYPHTESYTTYERYGNIAKMFPDAKVIMAHMCVSEWMNAVDLAEKYDNILLDTSGSTIIYGMLEIAAERIGAERILYGSDAPLYDPHITLSKVKDSDLSESDKRLILGENAVKIYGLENT
jgi:predicted TIM-barrel fold metal-dependent hydrolase